MQKSNLSTQLSHRVQGVGRVRPPCVPPSESASRTATLTDESRQKALTTLSVGSAMLFHLTHDAFKAYGLPQSLLLEVHPVSSPVLIAKSPRTVPAALKTMLHRVRRDAEAAQHPRCHERQGQ